VPTFLIKTPLYGEKITVGLPLFDALIRGESEEIPVAPNYLVRK